MGTRICKVEKEDWWLVYQSTSMSMYSPIFNSELAALIFARLYSSSSRGDLFAKDFSDQVQEDLSAQIAAYLDEVCKENAFGHRPISAKWIEEMDPRPADWDDKEDGTFEPDYAYDLLVEDFNKNYECAQADIVIRDFNVWRTETKQPFLPMKEVPA